MTAPIAPLISTATTAAGAPASPTGGSSSRSDKIRSTAKQLEGVFVLQMLKAMRETVPKGGVLEANDGEQTFTAMLDQKIAEKIPSQWKHGLTDALTNQLTARDGMSRTPGTATNPQSNAPEQSK